MCGWASSGCCLRKQHLVGSAVGTRKGEEEKCRVYGAWPCSP